MAVLLSEWISQDDTRREVLFRLCPDLANVLEMVSGLFVTGAMPVWSDLVRSDRSRANDGMVDYDLSRVPYLSVVEQVIFPVVFGSEESECDLEQSQSVNSSGDARFCYFCCVWDSMNVLVSHKI